MSPLVSGNSTSPFVFPTTKDEILDFLGCMTISFAKLLILFMKTDSCLTVFLLGLILGCRSLCFTVSLFIED